MKVDPIIAVKDVEASLKWYQSIFDWKSAHGGNEFDILVSENNEILLCLHKWEVHGHPSMQDQDQGSSNGLILYFRVENFEQIRENLRKVNYELDKEIHLSSNSGKREFSLRDPDGYYLIVAEFHEYKG